MDCWKADAHNLVHAKTAYFDDELFIHLVSCWTVSANNASPPANHNVSCH